MDFKPVTQMNTDELTAELEALTGSLPSYRHLPTVTLKKAIDLINATQCGATPEQRDWLMRLLAYSAQHAERFARVNARITQLRAHLVPGQPTEIAPPGDEQVHPLLTERQLYAVLAMARAFDTACECFVEGSCGKQTHLALSARHDLPRLDAAATASAEELTKILGELPATAP